MHTARKAFVALCFTVFSSCANSYSVQSERSSTQNISAPRLDFTSVIKIPRTQSGFDVGYGLSLQSNGDIWATGGWNTRGDHVYRWSLADRNWNGVKLPSAGGVNVKAKIYFANTRSGWVFKDRDIFQTRDGGQTWTPVPLEGRSEITRLQAVSFLDSDTGFIGGTTGFMNRDTFEPEQGIEILCTSDAGKEFQVCYKSKEHQTVHKIIALKQGKTAVALIDGQYFLITENDGRDWTEKALPASVVTAAADSQNTLWIAGAEGALFNSRDLGNSWNKPEISGGESGPVDWSSIAFGENGIGVAVGNNGIFAVSVNGTAWKVIKTDQITEDLFDIQISGSYLVVQSKDHLYAISILN